MDTNNDKIVYREESYEIVGAAMEVLKELGPGLLEKPYENALCCEFRQRGIPYSQQKRYPILYKGEPVGGTHSGSDCL